MAGRLPAMVTSAIRPATIGATFGSISMEDPNTLPDELSKTKPDQIPRGKTEEGRDQDFRHDDACNGTVLRADRLQKTDLLAALHNGGGHQIGNAQRRSDQAQGCDQDHEQLCLIEDRSLALGHFPDS